MYSKLPEPLKREFSPNEVIGVTIVGDTVTVSTRTCAVLFCKINGVFRWMNTKSHAGV